MVGRDGRTVWPEEGLEEFGDAGEFHRFSIVVAAPSGVHPFQIVDCDWRLERASAG